MRIIWTDAARDDLIEIRSHLKRTESPEYIKRLTQEIRDEVSSLKAWPNKGTYVPELEELNLPAYRQLLAGQNRIIFERTGDADFYVHIVCHTSRDLGTLLRRRLLSTE